MEDLNIHKELSAIEKENLELKKRNQELTDFIENGTVSLHWVDGRGIIIWANKAELDLLGYSRDEYVGFPIQNFHADSEKIEEILHRLLNNETLHDFPARLKCKNGSIKYVAISSNALIEDGEFIHSRCFTKDMTEMAFEEERKSKLMILLEESEERLRLALKAADLGTWDWDFETGKIHFSNEAKKILAIPSDEQSYDSILDFIHPDDRQRISSIVNNLKESNSDGHFNFVCQILRSGLNPNVWIKAQGSAYFSNSLRPRRIIGTIQDITDLKKSETKSAQLVAIVNSSYDAIIGKTLGGIITSWNDAAEQIFGYTSDEVIGESILKLIPEDRKHEEDYILDRMKSGESIEHFETKRLKKSGKILDVSLTISPIKDDQGEIIGISKIARDITEKKQEEQRKNDFVSMVSHELKTPLTSILLYAQVLQRKYREENNGQIGEIGFTIENQVKKMLTMVGDFLSLARIEEGKLQLRQEVFQLNELMAEAKAEAVLSSSRHVINIKTDDSITIFADRHKIGQVLTNLVSNAVKYSPVGGTVTIGCDKYEDKIRIYVSDGGVGISKSDQKKLFNRFYRSENEELSNIAGFGIGLYIVAEILRYHNTKIEVESELGVGSTFSFFFTEYHEIKPYITGHEDHYLR